ncbi:MAG: hypothetical protein A2931_02215 [Candidatus Niyogibacteria bacterium RIFCSPLOWO2_01_FULL_45_48]|uniref:Uncharacterized protein n=2 Tax=Candidatus Niyogiibacteriota TaxID=1817912 RepID=A0A1G2EZJ2_9BACT|nr:MAG: hypothetical protein A3J00_03895 [Candidatus Niyogibacteria bacterium RIFCSPLOWO2_02_FULL_45_13]OGZ31279.1 MAG: hypothetical protein A2931_02215 [Candidatus Niyogibacteria bacterium RIFCSPLOWO2_01_FULL_45_48]
MDKIKKIIQFFTQSTTKLNNLSLPAVILIASIVLGGFFYASQVNKQRSIEKQQQIELKAKTEKENREYIAKRKLDCLAIYKAEADKFSNVQSWNYDPTTLGNIVLRDICEIIYKDNKTGKNFSNYF